MLLLWNKLSKDKNTNEVVFDILFFHLTITFSRTFLFFEALQSKRNVQDRYGFCKQTF